MALSPLTPLSQLWERGELDFPPPKIGGGIEGGGGPMHNFIHLIVIGQQLYWSAVIDYERDYP